MSSKIKITHGFTMIELLVVMSIVGVLMALVGPMTLNSIDKAEAKTEKITLENWLSKISVKAFSTSKSYLIDLSAKKIVLYQLSTEFNAASVDERSNLSLAEITGYNDIDNLQVFLVSKKSFKYLSFPKQKFVFNNRGFVAPESLRYQYNSKTFTIALSTLINGETEVSTISPQNSGYYTGDKGMINE